MFGTSGIRGIYGKEITEELAFGVANIFVEKELVVGRDIRKSGASLRDAVSKGVLEAGADFIDLGIVPTPTVALAAKKCRGIMITASHNPPEYNGLKLIEKGKEICKELEKKVQNDFGKRRRGDGGQYYFDCDAVDSHKNLVMSLVDGKLIAKKKPKILVDCNGAACVITPSILTDLGCRVTSVNASLDCFNRLSEPSKENITYLCDLVRKTKADFAIAHDGDGDRCVIVDDTGEVLPFDVQLAMMIENELSSKNKKIISTVEASLAIREVVEKKGGNIEITPVGSTYVGDALERTNAIFGGEPCGEYIYKDGVHVPDAVLGAAKFVEIFCKKGKFSELKKAYRQYFITREKFPVKDRYNIIKKVKKSVNIEGKIRDDDGIRVDEEDGWFLIRASGTEPIIRLTMEYKTKERLEKRKAEITKLLKGFLV
ncbi:phosphoglucosamine mutase [Candidatus Micrarchaeota archaeon]|nr:phosphoglucosamine mutase [Candidatus Micrarchaeota archaeon]